MLVPLRRAVDLLVQSRLRMPTEELKANLLSGQHVLYSRLIAAYLKTHQPAKALEALLEAKGGVWADLAAPAMNPVPDQDWLQARAAVQTWQEEVRDAEEPAYQEYCAQRLSEAETEFTRVSRQQIRLRDPYPLPEMDAIREALPNNHALIEYSMLEDYVHAWVLTSHTPPHHIRVGKTAHIAQTMRRLSLLLQVMRRQPSQEQRQEVASGQQQAVNALLAQLYSLLIAPLAEQLPGTETLVIAPDAALFEVPWAALRGTDGAIIDQYPVFLIPSGSILALPRPAAPCTSPLALGCADRPPLPSLPYVARELAELEHVIPSLRVINPASVNDLKGVTAPELLHIAAHGSVNASAPLLSRIELADGSLLLADVLYLNVYGTRLVSLSACETGTLPEQGGALLALAGAFLCAGACAVMASLWQVEDEATHLLMTSFYTAYQQGVPVTQALTRAQQLVRAAGYEHPYYWAAFQLLVRATVSYDDNV
jgi:CHAT domain-containing protein